MAGHQAGRLEGVSGSESYANDAFEFEMRGPEISYRLASYETVIFASRCRVHDQRKPMYRHCSNYL